MAGESGGMCRKAASKRVCTHFATPCRKYQTARKHGETHNGGGIVRGLEVKGTGVVGGLLQWRPLHQHELGKKFNPKIDMARIAQRRANP